MTVEESTIQAGGLAVHALAAGEGEGTLVLLHGAEADGSMWRPYMEGLARGRRVLAPDLPGHGGSSLEPGTDCSPPGVARWFSGWLDAEGQDRVDLLGHSFGGVVAFNIALEAPGRVSRLVGVDVANLDWATGVFRDAAHQLLGMVAGEDMDEALARETLGRIYGRDAHSEETDEALAFWSRPGVRAFFRQGGTGFSRSLPVWRLREVSTPTLLVWGGRDRFFPLDGARTGALYLPDSRVVVMEEGTHSPFATDPELFYLVVDAFLSTDG